MTDEEGLMRYKILILSLVCLFSLQGIAHGSLTPGHHYSGESAFQPPDTPTAIREAIEQNKNAYYLGTQGHDLTYWAGFRGDPRLSANSDAEKMHEDRRSGEVIKALIDDLKKWKSKDDRKYKKFLAFVAGWITHYITDAYIHYLVGLYGGNYRDGKDGEVRHTQLEMAENYHICKTKSINFSEFGIAADSEIFTFLSESLSKVYPNNGDFKVHLISVDDGIGSHMEETLPFLEELAVGLLVLQEATGCFQEMCAQKSAQCNWNPVDYIFETMKGVKFLDDAVYEKVMNPVEIEEEKPTLFDFERGDLDDAKGVAKLKVTVWEAGFYKKFLTDWNTSMAKAIRMINLKFKRLASILNAAEDSGTSVKGIFPDIDILDPNINPDENIGLIDQDEDTLYDRYKSGLFKRPASSLTYVLYSEDGCFDEIKGSEPIVKPVINDSPLLIQSLLGSVNFFKKIDPKIPGAAECRYNLKVSLSDEKAFDDNKLKDIEWFEMKRPGRMVTREFALRISGPSEVEKGNKVTFTVTPELKGFTPSQQEAFWKNVQFEWIKSGNVDQTVYSDEVINYGNNRYVFAAEETGEQMIKVRAVRKMPDGQTREITSSVDHTLTVVDGYALAIDISNTSPIENTEVVANALLTNRKMPEDGLWNWKANGGLKIISERGENARIMVSGEGTLTVQLFVIGPFGKTHFLGEAHVDINPKEDKKDKEKAEKEKAEKEKAEKEKAEKEKADKEKNVPSCSYEYSEWGECIRETKKQTRTVTAKKPEVCVERQEPRLEQGCTPPPTEEDKRNGYFNCLCRCSSGWAGHIGVWYDPEQKTIPECKSSGPCIGGIGAWGCSRRHFFAGPSDCAKGCWEGVYGKGTYDPQKADKIRKDENKKFKQPLTVKIKASKNPADFGDIVDLTAETSEGSGGYKWDWGGCAQDAKDANAKVVNTRDCTSCAASVTVTDQDGDTASDSMTIRCTALQVKLSKEGSKENQVPIGGKATFLAEVFADGKPAGGTFFYIWEPNPDALFGDPKNPTYETQGGSQHRHTATFKRTGTTPVWVSVLKEIKGRKATVGESEQIPIEVIEPKLKLGINKQDPYIGEKVVITVQEEPKMNDEIITFWWEIKGEATSPGPEPNIPNSRAYSFRPKNNKPVTVIVHGKAKDDGSDLGTADITVNARTYAVSISEPRYLGPKPRIWKCDTQLGGKCPGLVEVGNQQFAVFHDVFMRATLTPSLSGARYRWNIDPAGTCGMPGAGDEIKMNCSDTGTYTVSLKVGNNEGDQVGEASQSVSISISQKDMDGSQKAKEAYDKFQKAKGLVAEGKLDEAIGLANEATSLDPKNAEAKSLSQKWSQEKQTVTQQIEKTKNLVQEAKFPEAQKELIVAKNLHGLYPPVAAAEKELSEKWRAYDSTVRDKLYEVRSANEKKDFEKALDLAQKMRKEMKLQSASEDALKQQEEWARRWETEKEGKRKIFSRAAEKLKNYDYAGAYKGYEEGFANAQNLWSGTEPEYKEAAKGREEAFLKNKRLNELIPYVKQAAEDTQTQMPVDTLQGALKTADEAIGLQPNNEQLKKWRSAIEGRLQKTTTDNQRLAQGRKYLEAARSAENSFLSQDSYVRSDPNRWGENIEGEMQAFLGKAIENYQASLQYIPDKNVEQRIKDLQNLLEGRKKYLENVRLSKKLLTEADVLAKEARAEQNFDVSQEKFAKAIETYQRSLNLYRPSNAETISRIISNLDIERKTNAFKKYRADGTALEQQNRPAEALAALEKAATFRTYAIPEGEWIQFGTQLQNLRSRVEYGRKYRVQGEGEEKAGKIAEAVASYEQSLKLIPDNALAERAKVLKAQLARGDDKTQKQEPPLCDVSGTWRHGGSGETWTFSNTGPGRYNAVEKGFGNASGTGVMSGNALRIDYVTKDGRVKGYYEFKISGDCKSGEGRYSDSQPKSGPARMNRLSGPGTTETSRGEDVSKGGFYFVDLTPYGGKKGTPRKVKEVEVDDGSWIRLKATHEKKLVLDINLPQPVTSSAIAVVTNLDNAHNVPDGFITTVLTVRTTPGERRFEFKAGVHSSEWNRGETGGADHKWPKETYIGDKRWMAVFQLPQGSKVTGMRFDHRDTDKKYYHMGAAPGFCLRGITLAGAAVSGATTTSPTGTTSTPLPTAKGNVIFNNGNIGGVSNSPSRATSFTLQGPHVITLIQNYHWNNGRGANLGTIALRASSGQTYGPWRTAGAPGQGGVPNAYWNAYPNTTLPAGTYTVIDSDPSSWAQNSESGGAGFSRVEGYPAGGTTPAGIGPSIPAGSTGSSGATLTVMAEVTNKSRQNAHIFVEGESFGPANRFVPGEARRVSVRMLPDGTVTFKAGRDGQVMATKRWTGDPNSSGRVPVVIFDDTNPYDKLVITTGLR